MSLRKSKIFPKRAEVLDGKPEWEWVDSES